MQHETRSCNSDGFSYSTHYLRDDSRQWRSGQQDGPRPISYGFDHAWRLALRAVSISNN